MAGKSLFEFNRKQLINKLPAGSLVILQSNILYPRNGDQFFPFRQDSNFYYLTGLNFPDLVFILYKGNNNGENTSSLFVSLANLNKVVWEGEGLNRERAGEISGIKNIKPYDEWQQALKQYMFKCENVYVDFEEGKVQYFHYKSAFFNRIKQEYPFKKYRNIQDDLSALRVIKNNAEIQTIKRAVKITSETLHEVSKKIKPGTTEKIIEGEITGAFFKRGAAAHAFYPIVASGINACTLHYTDNNSPVKNGDLVLIDFGAEFENYAADCTRTLPADKKFSKRQREIYSHVLEIFLKTRELIKPGISIMEINRQVEKWSGEAHVKLGLYTKNQLKNNGLLVKRFYPHGACHFLGLDVHDTGNREMPLQQGMVLTCEPGIYIPGENTGIRLENDILVTGNGHEDLMKDMPIEIIDIEHLMH